MEILQTFEARHMMQERHVFDLAVQEYRSSIRTSQLGQILKTPLEVHGRHYNGEFFI